MSPFGKVPYIAPDGRRALTSYAKPFTPQAGKQYISVVIGGLGINPALTRRAINELPGSVTLSFAVHAPGLQLWINQARARGHEVLIELPMEANAAAPNTKHILNACQTRQSKHKRFRLST